MKIKFNKRKLYTDLILGMVWVVLGCVYLLLSNTDLLWIGYGFMLIGVFDIFHFLYDKKKQYLIITNGTLQKNILYSFKNKMQLDDVQEIKNEGGDYILKSESKHLKINPDIIDNESLIELIEVLKNLNLPSEKTCLAN